VKLSLSQQLKDQLASSVDELISNRVASRVSQKDFTLWGPDAEAESRIRLGWTESASTSAELIPSILQLRDEFRSQGIDRFVLCGMGGSSLAPEVIAKTSGVELTVLDSTDPAQVLAALIELDRTAVVVSSKSGSTVETDSQKRAFEAAFKAAGIDPLTRIVIVTDPGSPLDQASRAAGYRVFNADPNVGGRYSALTAFGLVPTGLAGANVEELLQSASSASSSLTSDGLENPALWLGAAMARTPGAARFKDKFLIETDQLAGFGDWAEQLVAESTGKEQLGILPVVVTADAPELQLNLADTLVVRYSDSQPTFDGITFSGQLGELFLLWEYATAVAGYLMQINPFDQPNVESAKIAARALLDSPALASEPDFVDRGVAVKAFGFKILGATVEAALEQLMAAADENTYFSIHVYLSRPEFPQFEGLRDVLAARTSRPVTFGWGPRFLHSTGQYHKGGPRQGLFIQITFESETDLEIEGRPFSFGTLISAQAAGDAKVLEDNGLKVVTLKLSNPLADLNLIERVIRS
jgi:glucose-6-phosphate isomerase